MFAHLGLVYCRWKRHRNHFQPCKSRAIGWMGHALSIAVDDVPDRPNNRTSCLEEIRRSCPKHQHPEILSSLREFNIEMSWQHGPPFDSVSTMRSHCRSISNGGKVLKKEILTAEEQQKKLASMIRHEIFKCGHHAAKQVTSGNSRFR